ncbi:LuxR C-terminal-related transcriptional regulator [Pedomonas mirosovicensis]|uniref:LuxR C-terminal-related transcriptional regulator n=1 Tax=Pedomonas mirosovicensis TaxID=2908641 RepID=UPI00216905F5|nr:LuxR C-terminal-related transcriptional regulator [Pedomonas mirosovicensis]MCH8686533.1 LuxR C-terminal-related transcriptional regulator [Pedomonas mirosovicensis]
MVGKLRPPQQRLFLMDRPALLARLDEALSCPLTIMLAPPGFGKSTLLTQWWHRLRAAGGTCVAWLTLDERDAEITSFVAHLILALTEAGVDLGMLDELARRDLSQADAKATIYQLLDLLHRGENRVVIILDDYHRVRSDPVDAIMNMIIRNGGARMHMVVSGRDRPNLALAELETRGLVSTFDAHDLVMSFEDTFRFFRGRLSREEAEVLHRRTEGWAVTLQLASLWLDKDDRRRQALHDFSGRTVEITRYLVEQVLSDLSQDLQDFLVDTSILERFDASLANAVRDRDDSELMLERLAHFDALLLALDSGRRWFRYHHLFADFLRQRLLLRGADQVAGLHHRAALRLNAEGNLLEAVHHALQNGDTRQAIGFVRAAGGWELILSRGIGFVRNLLKNFSEDAIRSSSVLLLAQGYLQIKLGNVDAATRWIEQAAIVGDKEESTRRDQIIVETLLRAYADDLDMPGWTETLTSHIEALDRDDHLGRATLLAALAVSALAMGDFQRTEHESRAGMREMEVAGSVLGNTYCMFHLAQSWFYRGLLREAEALLRQALVIAEAHYGQDSALKAIGSCLLAQILFLGNETDEALTRITSALPAVEAHDSWMDVLASAYGTAVMLERADRGIPAALKMVERAEATGHARGLGCLIDMAAAWRLELLLALDPSAANAYVRAAELEHRLKTMVGPYRWRQRTALGMALGQWHLAGGRSADALRILRPIEEECATAGRKLDGGRVALILAAVFKQRGEGAKMIENLCRGLDQLMEPGAMRLALDLAVPVAPLLQYAAAEYADQLEERQGAYISSLLHELKATTEADPNELSGREREVLRQLCLGYSNKLIGANLDLSENTVKFHLKRIYQKLGANSRSAAVLTAIRRQLVDAAP